SKVVTLELVMPYQRHEIAIQLLREPDWRTESVRRPMVLNHEQVRRVALDELLRGASTSPKRGAGLLALRAPDAFPEYRLGAVTDLAITAKMSRHGSLAWVTRLSDGAPVAGATVSVRVPSGEEKVSVTTDADGVAVVSAQAYTPVRGHEIQ